MPPRPPAARVIDLAVRRYEEGRSLSAIAGELQVSKTSVRRWLLDRNITMRPPHRRTAPSSERPPDA